MKIKFLILNSLLFLALQLDAQWTQRTSFTGISRAKATSFIIGNEIYLMGGVDNSGNILGDFWLYDIATDSWTQKPDFPGQTRYGATSFVLGNTGYIAAGGNDNGFHDDLWQYDPATGNWFQRTGLPATTAQHENQRVEPYSFVIGNKAYLGGGSGFVFTPNSTNNYAFHDIWEYNPSNNTWVEKTSTPDALGRNMSVGVAINNKGYIGLGCDVDQTTPRQTFWEYDPSSDTWTAKSDFPTLFTTDAAAFSLGSKMYVVGGVNFNPVTVTNQFYEYDPVTDIWTMLPDFNGGNIVGAFAVSNNSTAFVGTGYNGNIITRNDLWELGSIPAAVNDENGRKRNGFNLYPNPAIDRIKISSEKNISLIEIYIWNGSKVSEQSGSVGEIDISELNAGFYFMNVKFEDGSTRKANFFKCIQ